VPVIAASVMAIVPIVHGSSPTKPAPSYGH
jgi:hypothetical protein